MEGPKSPRRLLRARGAGGRPRVGALLGDGAAHHGFFRAAAICGISPHEKKCVRASRLPADTGGAGATPRSAVVPALEEWARSPIVG
jgi:hypothetical protein